MIARSSPVIRYNFDPLDFPSGVGPSLLHVDEEPQPSLVPQSSLQNFLRPGLLTDPEEIPAGNLLIHQGSGDGSQSTASWLAAPKVPIVRYNFDPENPGGLIQSFIPEEEIWQNGVTNQLLELPDPTILWFSDDISAYPVVDEEFWVSGVAPIPLTFAPLQQWIFETDEFVPAPVFAGQADEDFWVNPVAPVPYTLAPLQQFAFDPMDTAPLFGQFDEDFWVNAVAPVSYEIKQSLPVWFDAAEIIVPVVPGDYDQQWQNWVAPVPASNYLTQPYQWDFNASDIFVPPVPIVLTPVTGGYTAYGLQSIQNHLQHI